MPSDQKAELTFRRHAEAIVPNELRLAALQAVLCRTAAEMETLLCLLSDGAKDRWAKCIGTKASLFYRHWSYVESVTLTNEAAVFMFHPSSRTPGPFAAEARFVVLPSGKAYRWKNDSFFTNRAAKFGAARAGSVLRVGLAHAGRPSDYKVQLRLDSELAYANSHHEDSIPF